MTAIAQSEPLISTTTTTDGKISPTNRRGLVALAIGAFGIGLTEFVIMGLLLDVSSKLDVTVASAGLLISGYALGVVVGGPLLTLATARLPRRAVLLMLMTIFTLGNVACALAPGYGFLMLARIVTGFAHGTFFGVGAIVAQQLVPADKKASAIALMFTGLTLANVLGVPFGTWIGQIWGWRATFVMVSVIGVIAIIAIAMAVPRLTTNASPDTGGQTGLASLATMARKGPLLALAMTVLGYAGVFLLFTYIAPVLTKMSGFSQDSVSLLLLLFGFGLVLGNLAGGWLADRSLRRAALGTLLALSATLILSHWVFTNPIGAGVFILVFGATAFSTVAPLQAWTIQQAEGADPALASTFNISAFNLGNAIGAWMGGRVLDAEWGLPSLFLVAAIPPALAACIAFFVVKGETA